jgi:cell division protein FtsB
VLLVLAVFVRIFVPVLSRKYKISTKQKMLENKIKATEQQIKGLEQEILKLKNDNNYIEKIAREELGFAREGEIVYNIKLKTEKEK